MRHPTAADRQRRGGDGGDGATLRARAGLLAATLFLGACGVVGGLVVPLTLASLR